MCEDTDRIKRQLSSCDVLKPEPSDCCITEKTAGVWRFWYHHTHTYTHKCILYPLEKLSFWVPYAQEPASSHWYFFVCEEKVGSRTNYFPVFWYKTPSGLQLYSSNQPWWNDEGVWSEYSLIILTSCLKVGRWFLRLEQGNRCLAWLEINSVN